MRSLYAFLEGIAALTLTACTSGEEHSLRGDDVHYFCGEFVQNDDTVWFYDGATGAQYPVSRQEAFDETVRKYKALNPSPGQSVFIELNGALISGPHSEDIPFSDSLVIESLIGFNPAGSGQSSPLIVGLYEAFAPDRTKTVLHLKPDYTYVLTRYASDTQQTSQTGNWNLRSASEVDLSTTNPEGHESHLQLHIGPQSDILWHNTGNQSLCYRKVYL